MVHGNRGRHAVGGALFAILLAIGRAAGAGDSEGIRVPLREVPAPPAIPPPREPRLRLVWIDVLDSAPFAFRYASREASAILADAGVATTWTLGDASTVTGEDELKIVLMPGAANGARLPAHVMGGTPRGARSHTTWVYLSNVLWALGVADRAVRSLAPSDEATVARALGRVVAHEIVHAVAPEVPHSRSGLMADRMGRGFMLLAHVGLAPAQQAALRAGVHAFAAPSLEGAAPVEVVAGRR